MSINDLPKHYHGGSVRLTKEEKKRLDEWVLREEWTKEKTINRQFRFEHSMPINLVASGISQEHWSRNGKMVCVMCGYVTCSTNICRHCLELPADEPATRPVWCDRHKTYHMVDKAPTMHRSIAMVCVS